MADCSILLGMVYHRILWQLSCSSPQDQCKGDSSMIINKLKLSETNNSQKHFHCFHPKDENSPTFIGKTSGNGHEPMDLRTSWARSDEDLAMTHTAEKLPAAIRERSNETRRSLISRLACSSTSTDQTLQTTLHFW